MPEELFRQEFFCDFSAANVGAILGRWVEQAEKDGRMSDEFEYDPEGAPVEISSDIGFRDTACWWFWQPYADGFALVDYDQDSGLDADEWCERIEKKLDENCMKLGKIWLPHDARAKTFATRHSAVETFLKKFSASRVDVVPQTKKLDKINAARYVLPRCRFHKSNCAKGLDGLRAWAFEWNPETKQFSRDPKHDWACFHPDTKVLTRYGTHRIIDLPDNGEVMTPCGWKRYEGPRITRRNARLVEVVFKDGHTVKCTPDHLFLTKKGWKSAESLTKGTLIQSSLTLSRSISMAVYIACGQAKNTLQGAVKSCIGAFGNWLLAPFQTDATFTTRMEIPPTTYSQILSANLQTSTCLGLGTTSTVTVPSEQQRERELRRGINQKPDYSGTEGNLKASKTGSNGRGWIRLVQNVGRFSKHLIEVALRLKNSAPTFAESLIIESVSKLEKKVDTYCIHVADGHWFSLENGAVVHNSHPGDGFSEGALVMRERVKSEDKGEKRQDIEAFGTNGFRLPCLEDLWKSTPKRPERY